MVDQMSAPASSARRQTLTITARPEGILPWLRSLTEFRAVTWILIKKDFRTRYKRTSFGILWAVAVPAVQAGIMAVVFSHVVRTRTGVGFPVYVIAGVIAFSYFSSALPLATSSIVDGASLTDKVWFPRVILVLVPCATALVGFAVTAAIMIAIIPAFHVGYTWRLTLLAPAIALLLAFTLALSLVASALHVYFRDMKFIIQAALMVWIYVTPIVYYQSLLGHYSYLLDANPLTGVVDLFHLAVLGSGSALLAPVLVSVGVTTLLLTIGIWTHSYHDRLFVDQL